MENVTMANVITAAVDEFRVKLADAIYDNMVEECFIDAGEDERHKIVELVCSAKYEANTERLILCTLDHISSYARIMECIAVILDKYIENIYFCADLTNEYVTFDIRIYIKLKIHNIVELFYFEKAKAEIDQ